MVDAGPAVLVRLTNRSSRVTTAAGRQTTIAPPTVGPKLGELQPCAGPWLVLSSRNCKGEGATAKLWVGNPNP